MDALPYDILYQIFQACLSENLGSPILLSHVCRSWRSAAVTSAALWSRIELDGSRLKVERLKMELVRSQDAPLRISIGSEIFRNSSLKTLRMIMRLLHPHIHRWASFYIDSAPYKVVRVLLDSLRGCHLPLLESFGYHVCSRLKGRWRSTDPLSTMDCPRLKVLTVDPTLIHYSHSIFTQLSSLTIGDPWSRYTTHLGAELVHCLLKLLPQLVSLHILWSARMASRASKFLLAWPKRSTESIQHGLQTLYLPVSTFRVLAKTVVLPQLQTFYNTEHDPNFQKGLNEIVLLMWETLLSWNTPIPFRTVTLVRDRWYTGHLQDSAESMRCFPQLATLILRKVPLEHNTLTNLLGDTCPVLSVLAIDRCSGLRGFDLVGVLRIRAESRSVTEITLLQIHQHDHLLIEEIAAAGASQYAVVQWDHVIEAGWKLDCESCSSAE